MNTEEIGKFIAQVRKEKNMTQKNLAEKLYITDRAISKWERGKCLPDIQIIEKLCKELDISIIEFFKGRKIEDVNNDELFLIQTLKISNKNTKEKYTNIISKFLVCLFIILLSFYTFYNLKNIYYNNRVYYSDSNDGDSIIEEVDILKKTILNNQGNFTDDEYALIKESIKDLTIKDNAREILNKSEFKLKDVSDYLSLSLLFYNLNLYNNNLDEVYKILIKKDDSKIDNYIQYKKYLSFSSNAFNELLINIRETERYDYKPIPYLGDNLKYMIIFKYGNIRLYYKDIIEVGEIK